MKNIKSAFLSLTILIVLMLECVIPVAANEQDIQSFAFENGEIVITFDVSGLEEDDISRILATVLNAESEDGITTMSLLCTLFGHNMEYRNVYVVEHKAFSNSPRCLRKTYEVGICSRCEHETSELKGSIRIICCS